MKMRLAGFKAGASSVWPRCWVKGGILELYRRRWMFCRDEQFRIDHRPVENDAPVQMRAGGAAGLAGKAEPLAFAHRLAGSHVDAVEVAVQGDEPVAMVDEDRLAVEEIIRRRQHHALRARPDRRSALHHHIQPGMRHARLAVEVAAHPEASAQPSPGRKDEGQIFHGQGQWSDLPELVERPAGPRKMAGARNAPERGTQSGGAVARRSR